MKLRSSNVFTWHGLPAHEYQGHLAPVSGHGTLAPTPTFTANKSPRSARQGPAATLKPQNKLGKMPRILTGWKPVLRAFSLPEVMFAIMILGIGFIMVAAMFPVAMQQAKDSHDDTTAAEVAKSAVNIIQNRLQAAPANQPPATGNVYANTGTAENWNFWADASYGTRGSVIYQPDPRFAWTALYRRANPGGNLDPFVQVAIFIVNSTDGRPFTIADDIQPPPTVPCNLWPRRVEIRRGASADKVEIRKDTTGSPLYDARGAVVENAYLLHENGDIFRVASYVGPGSVSDTDEWQLYPGQGATPALPATWDKAWLVGRRVTAGGTPPTFDGPAQDIALFTTYLRAN